MAQGCGVNIPYGDNSKYDFIADINGNLYKIQVTTASIKGDAIYFSCRSTHVNCAGVKNERYKAEDVDYFATYWEGNCYLVPISECSAIKTLRLDIPKKGQLKGISFAKDYELAKQLSKIGGSN